MRDIKRRVAVVPDMRDISARFEGQQNPYCFPDTMEEGTRGRFFYLAGVETTVVEIKIGKV